MATSRTGTATWKRVRQQRLDHDRDAGLMHCPRCRVRFDWEYSRRPNSPEPDHIIPWKQGGSDTFENTVTICRRCNQSIGDKKARGKKRAEIITIELDNDGYW